MEVFQTMEKAHRGLADHIVGNKIILDAQGQFPKKVIIRERGRIIEYRLVRTQLRKYQLTK
jgi:hypothetical protein